MTENETLANDLHKAYHRFNKEYGKFEKNHAEEVLFSLELNEDAHDLVQSIIDNEFQNNSFAGFLRVDGIVGRIQIAALRASKE